jgi:hypothetical protein
MTQALNKAAKDKKEGKEIKKVLESNNSKMGENN